MPDQNTRLVYSTDGGRVRDLTTPLARPSKPRGAGKPGGRPVVTPPDDGVVRVRRETSGRKGKVATTITGLAGAEADLDELLKVLKQLCGAGGARDGRTLELQGDHRERVQSKLEALGHRVKLAGG